MRLQLMTSDEVGHYLETSRGAIVPIGATEQHGPNGLIGTDAQCAEAVALGVGERTGAVVAPVIAVGMSQHHLDFPGSMTLRPTTLIAVVRDMVVSLARNGFERFLFINGHGGNMATLGAAFGEINAEVSLAPWSGRRRVRCEMHNWYDGPNVRALSAELFGDQEGRHATPSEVAVTQHLFPDAIKQAELGPLPAPARPHQDAEDYRALYPDGRIGSNPGLATPAHGARLLETAIADCAERYRAFLAAP